jgi:uncharacterized repeat protein (TIGR01451 family)
VTFAVPTLANVSPGAVVSASISFLQTAAGVAGTGTTGALNDTVPGNNVAIFNVPSTLADMSASFAGFPANAAANTVVSGTANFTNISGTATSATFSLQLPAGLVAANVTVTSALLGAGTYNPATGSVTFAVPTLANVSPGAVVSASISFLQTAAGVAGTGTTGALNDTNLTNNKSQFNVSVTALSDMSASFAGFPPTALVNTLVTGAVNFTNVGGSTATTATFSLQLPGGLNPANVTVTSAVLGAGTYNQGSGQVTFPTSTLAKVTPGAVVSASISFLQTSTGVNGAASTGALNDTNPTNNNASFNVGLAAPPVVIADVTIAISSPANATPGQVIPLIITISNNGPSPAVNVNAVITLPNGSTQTIAVGTLNTGGIVTTTIAYSVPFVSTTVQTFSGVVSTDTTESNLGNNTAVTSTNLIQLADVAISMSVPPTTTVGQTVSLIVTINNNGPSPAANVSAVITLPNGSTQTITVGTLAVNGTQTVAIAYTVPLGSTTLQTFKGVVTTTTAEYNLANNTATVSTIPILLADVGIAISVPSTVTVGQTITATITISNYGPSPASDVNAILTLPNGSTQTIAVGNMSVSSTFTVSIAYGVPLGSTTVQTFNGRVTSTTADTNLPNNTATGVTTLILLADVAIAIGVPPSSTAGQIVTATITISNNGPSPASNVNAVITLPDGTTQTIAVGTLSANGTQTSFISYGIPQGSTTVQTFSGFVTTTTADTNLANNTATATILLPADVTTRVTVPANVSVSVVISGTVSFANIGGSPALNVGGTVTLPPGVAAKSIPAGANTATVAGLQVIVFPANMPGLGTVIPGVTTSFTFTFRTPVVTGTYSVTSTVATSSPEAVTANNISAAPMTLATPVTNATLSGRVYIDILRNKVFDNGTDKPLANFRAEVVRLVGGTTIVYGSALTNEKGEYVIKDLPVGGGFSVRFFDSGGTIIFGTPYNTSPVRDGQQVSQLGNPSTGSNTVTGPVTVTPGTPFGAAIEDVTLYPDDNVTEQNLPLDPSGVVYNSITRDPVKGATVKLVYEGTGVFNPAVQTLDGTDTVITGVNGFYQFWFINNSPSGVYRLEVTQPTGYLPPEAVQGGVIGALPVLRAEAGDTRVQPQVTAPAVGVNGGAAFVGLNGPVGTQYFFRIDLNLPSGLQVFNNHIPLDPILVPGALLVSKTGDKTVAELGDSVQYTIRIRNTTVGPITKIKLSDLLPAGFRYILGTARLGGVAVANPAGGVGRELTFDIGTIAAQATAELTYFVRLGVGSQQGDGINRAQVVTPVLSNVALYKVTVQGGVFSNDGCIIGKVYVDCDGNSVQNSTGGSRELGIPGVRLVMLDGTFILTDVEGKYSICGVKPQTHVIKVDRTTLPRGSRLVPSSNRNAGVGDSLFVDLKGGELARANFIEGSCSPEVLDQVKARRAQGGVVSPAVEKKLPLKIENRPAEAVQQILPDMRQQLAAPVKPAEAK